MIKRGLFVLAVLSALSAPPAPARPGPAAPSLEPYRGLGAWVDIFEDRAWRRPARAVADMRAHGVRTLFLETSNYTQRRAIAHPEGVGRFIDAAHARDMDVVAWYLPGFVNLKRDLHRAMKAIRFRTGQGERFDSFGLDIEASVVDPPSKRSRRTLSLSRRIRQRVGPDYTLGAIIPSPRGIELAGDYWPGFPYAGLAGIFDAFVPMGYFTFHVKGPEKTHDDTVQNIEILREETGDPTVPIHLIGGIADDASAAEVRGFVHAVRERGVLGASLYNYSLSRDHDWAELAAIPRNPRQSPALPVPLGYTEALGNIPGGDGSHPKEVFFRAGGLPGARTLTYEALDIGAGEVELWVNWVRIGPLAQSGTGWEAGSIPVPDELLADTGENYIAFTAAGNHPDWSEWGVRAVGLTP